jgi:deoxyribodipyrimidine photolyase-related protein
MPREADSAGEMRRARTGASHRRTSRERVSGFIRAVTQTRSLVIVLGDQLDRESAAFDGFDSSKDRVWMAEVEGESTHVWSTKQRTALFLSAMRHFAAALRESGVVVAYTALDDSANTGSLASELERAIRTLKPKRLVMTVPGDFRVLASLRAVAEREQLSLEVRDDRHFFATTAEFAAFATHRKQVRLEHWVRLLRKKHRVLLDGDGEPEGGAWSFDAENRGAFAKGGPERVPAPARFEPDVITREVIALVNARFKAHPGSLASFAWPVTRAQALESLALFIKERLPQFGVFQDAMWSGETWLFHSHLSAALNLKLLNPREVVDAAERAYRAGRVPLASAEGFIRQIIGWREYVRGLYWARMPRMLEENALGAHEALPAFYWTGDTEMACLRDTITRTLAHGYAHHIERLMVTGLYALLLGVEPKQVHAWFLAVYVDAVEWVELPNTLGMSQYADGGVMASKPYVASGKYIERMSNHCRGCRFDPAKAVGDDACPFTTLYWDFLARHEARLSKNPRTVMQVKNLKRKPASELVQIRARAASLRSSSRPG